MMQKLSRRLERFSSRHVQGRKAEFLQHSLNIAERYIPQDRQDKYRLEIEEEKNRLMGVYSWADYQDRKRENHIYIWHARL